MVFFGGGLIHGYDEMIRFRLYCTYVDVSTSDDSVSLL